MKKIISLIIVFLFVVSCSTVPITGRKRINLVSDAQVLPTSFAQYAGFLKENKLSSDISKTRDVQEAGMKISRAVDRFMRANGMISEANNYRWEFNLIEDKTVNAWCMPGGKVVFYTGILPICDNLDGIAAVMGHEVAHAFAKHGQERMTTSQFQQLGGVGMQIFTGTSVEDPKKAQIFNMLYGVGSTLGVLKFSRTHETEADKLGMVFMIMAGYNPKEAVNVWIRMSERVESSQAPPEFLSTHPSNQSRIKVLNDYIPTAIAYAKKYNQQATIQQQQKVIK